jgi:glycosyltransferase involved in cell wall biosynthesis
VLPNPVDPSDIVLTQDPQQLRADLGVPEGAPLFGGVAHLRSEKKGWQEWIEAVPQVLKTVPDAHFWISGQGPLRPQYEALAEQLGVSHRVKFLGFRRDVADVMNAVDVMALASHREPFGIVYVEAALLGKPCIACNAGGAPDVVQDGETGILVPPRNPQKIAEAMIHFAQNRDIAKTMGDAGREYALEHFGWERTIEKLEGIYTRMGLDS